MKFIILDDYTFTVTDPEESSQYEELLDTIKTEYCVYFKKEVVDNCTEFTILAQKISLDEFAANSLLWRLLYFFKIRTNYMLLGHDGCEPTFSLELEYHE